MDRENRVTAIYTDSTPIQVGKLSPSKAFRFDLRPDEAQIRVLRDDLELLGLRKLRLHGEIKPDGARDWRLVATLGATVTQPCVATLEPVTTRIEEKLVRRYLKDWPLEEELGEEVEMPEDDSIDPLDDEIDLVGVLQEALSLALPTYPRADGAGPVESESRPDGAEPIDSSRSNAFSALADLKKKMEENGD
jgi:uncharacterized metal-binding protein YceD (DUF177 family)